MEFIGFAILCLYLNFFDVMKTIKHYQTRIWWLALGYFLFYVPYSAMTKALSKGYFSNTGTMVAGFELLPAVIIGTILTFILILVLTGWWKYAGRINVFHFSVPFVSSKWTFFSGVAAAAIIATTTLAYTFTGISIVFAALLMRGGVLLMAPLWDTYFKRKVYWYSWVAFGLSLFALILLFTEKGGYTLTAIALLNILSYLSGYFFRLNFMTRIAKKENNHHRYQFFVEEMLSAMLVLLIVPVFFALIGYGEIMSLLRLGFTEFIFSDLALPALIIGGLYACLYIFGTRIYLDKRENTFCIPINRCASLLAGVVASFILGWIFNANFISPIQLWSAVILCAAILFLGYPEFEKWKNKTTTSLILQNHLFVCSGNTSRSPMAQQICQIGLQKALLKNNIKKVEFPNIWSVGLNASMGKPLSHPAKKALEKIDVSPMPHASRNINQEDIKLADKIWCMSGQQKMQIIEKFPESQPKINRLKENGDIPNPAGQSDQVYESCAKQLFNLINARIIQPELMNAQTSV